MQQQTFHITDLLVATRKLSLLAAKLAGQRCSCLIDRRDRSQFLKGSYVRILASSSIMSHLCHTEFLRTCCSPRRCLNNVYSMDILQSFGE